jgi:hypothetical protein
LIFEDKRGIVQLKEISKKQINFIKSKFPRSDRRELKAYPEVDYLLRANINESSEYYIGMCLKPLNLRRELDMQVKIEKNG